MSVEQPPPERPQKRPKQAGEATRRKRGQGEGSIHKRRSGRWYGQIMVGTRPVRDGVTGQTVYKRDIRSVTRNTRQEVVAALAEIRRQYDAGVLPDANRMTLADLLERWLSTFVSTRRSASTAKAYTNAVRQHLIPRLGSAKLARLAPMRLTQAINEVAGTGLAPNTVAGVYTALSSALSWAVKMRLLTHHPLQGLERPRRGESAGRVFSGAELRALLTAARDYRDGQWWAPFALMASTGLTTGEMLALKWGDVSRGGVLRIGKAARHRPRQVPLSPLGLEALRLARTRQLGQQLALGGDWPWLPDPEGEWNVFTADDGRQIDHRRAQEAFAQLVKRAGLDGRARPHDLRHTWNTVASAGGYDARLRAQHLGHTTAINQSTYTHPNLEQQTAMARDVERRLLEDAG